MENKKKQEVLRRLVTQMYVESNGIDYKRGVKDVVFDENKTRVTVKAENGEEFSLTIE